MKGPKPERIDLKPEELDALLKRIAAVVGEKDYKVIKGMAETITVLSQAVQEKSTSIKRLLRMLFGARTEKTSKVLPEASSAGGSTKDDVSKERSGKHARKKRRGHGRNGVSAYSGAEKVVVPHQDLRVSDQCPECSQGRVYGQREPGVVVRVVGQAPLKATVYELEKLRCNLCGQVFTASSPAGVGSEKYDATAGSMVALMKYGSGLPFNRLEKLQGGLGIPLPAATQWEIVERVANRIYPAFDELKRQAAQGDVLHNDDTPMKILALMKENAQEGGAADSARSRTGIFTTGIVSVFAGHKIALFATGRKHAGENLADVLALRNPDLPPPIQMCDGLSRNTPGEFKTILANCGSHARRRYVDVIANFPDECRHVLDVIKGVYKNDAITKAQHMSPMERLKFHQAQSGPLMDQLHEWITAQLEEKKVEPNSGLGDAIAYMLKHWKPLTLFLRKPGAPLDNNICERVLKKAILHRKNALFYRTEHGAYIGDLFMSLIHSCELEGENAFEYLTALQKHSAEVRAHPEDWMPWNFRVALARSGEG